MEFMRRVTRRACGLVRCRRAGIELLEDRDDMRIGKAALAHMSFLAGPYARELTVSACPNLPSQVKVQPAPVGSVIYLDG